MGCMTGGPGDRYALANAQGSVTIEHVPAAPADSMQRVELKAAESLLMQYSEWIDCEVDWENTSLTHDDLIKAFLAQRNPKALPWVWGSA